MNYHMCGKLGIEGEFLVANITWKHDGLLLVLAPRINNVKCG